MRYGLISHVTPSGITFREIRADIPRYAYRKYYCKNMRYRINIAYYTSKSGIWLVILRVASYFHEPEASANTAYEWNNIAILHDECNKWFILCFIFF